MNNTGRVHAFDLDAKRLGTLRKLTAKAGCTNIQARHLSFLDTNPQDYANVSGILLDPSCSGSGIINRLDQLIDVKDEGPEKTDRLARLSSFQVQMVEHAMTCRYSILKLLSCIWW